MARVSQRRRSDRPRQKSRIQFLFHERFGGERLEERRVMDASAIPLWEQAPAVLSETLSLDAGFTATAAAQAGDFAYTTANGAVTITGYTGAGGVVEIPATINGLPVSVIGVSAFNGKTNLTGVTIPSGVKDIGDTAFRRPWTK